MPYSATNTAKELLPFIDQALEHFGPIDIWWRGQAVSDWNLHPGICRRSDSNNVEQDFTNRFRRKALSRHLNCPPIYDNSGWLFLMQHYRLPTRLLDWSESILIATYFAVNEEFDNPGALWALSPSLLNEAQFGKRCIFEPDGRGVLPLIKHAFDRESQKISKVAAVSSKEIDVRLMVQLSVFTIHGSCDPLESWDSHENYLIKFEIPAERKKRLLQLLYDLGIRESNIFPDLEHLAHDMSAAEYSDL